MNEQKIIAYFIIEMMGKPEEHLKDTMEKLIEKLGTEEGVKIVEKIIHEPKKVEIKNTNEETEKKFLEKIKNEENIQVIHDIFTTFSEIEAEFDNLYSFLNIIFKYIPSNVEIIKPENFIIRNSDLGEIITSIILRLHKYDEIAKKITIDKALLEEKLRELIGNKKS
ncbi:MAG: hypothetical protein QW727_02580 [Candidatus Pacearchaeota archaeon]